MQRRWQVQRRGWVRHRAWVRPWERVRPREPVRPRERVRPQERLATRGQRRRATSHRTQARRRTGAPFRARVRRRTQARRRMARRGRAPGRWAMRRHPKGSLRVKVSLWASLRGQGRRWTGAWARVRPQAPYPQAPHPQAPRPQAPRPQAPRPQTPHPQATRTRAPRPGRRREPAPARGWAVGSLSPEPLRGLLRRIARRLRKRYRPAGAPEASAAPEDRKNRRFPPGGGRVIPRPTGPPGAHVGPAHESGKRARKPFGPDPSRRRRARNSVVYWAPGPVPGPTPRPVGVPRLDGPTALHLAVWTESHSVTDAGSDDVRDGQPAKSRAGLRSKLPTPPQMSTVSRSAETSSFRR